MKLQPDRLDGVNVITRHEAGAVWVQAERWTQSLVVPWRGAVQPWSIPSMDSVVNDYTALEATHFDALLAWAPELVIFGSGPRLRFVSPAFQRELFARRIGIETMDTAAACRTYNVLATEGRSVVAALLLPGPSQVAL